jgi:hypothetical protein
MALKIKHGKLIGGGKKEGDFFKQRVAVVTSAGKGVMQFVSGMLMLRIKHAPPGAPPVYEAPIEALWANMRENYPEETAGLDFIGVLATVLHGPWAGHIDWVQPLEKEPVN